MSGSVGRDLAGLTTIQPWARKLYELTALHSDQFEISHTILQ